MTSISATVRASLAGVVLVPVLVVSSCGSSQADGEVSVLPPRDAAALVQEGTHTAIDLRSRKAFRAGHVQGAVTLPVGAPDFEERLLGLPRDGKYLVYSRAGEDAERVADRMAVEGFETVVDGGAFGLLAIAGAPLD